MDFFMKRAWDASVAALAPAVLGCVVVALWSCYSRGLSGPFLLDDFHNLGNLSLLEGGLQWERLSEYLNSGIAGPSGRPLALLSFLLNDLYWPTSPWPFKNTNVLIHALNSILVFWCMLLLVQCLHGNVRRERLLLIGLVTMLWAFNPYHVSTVLYVVQRMAMLATLFVLLGLVLYVKGRSLLMIRPHSRLAWFLILCAYGSGLGLGVLSKENAALFVLMVPLVEWIFFHMDRMPSGPRLVLQGVLIIPSILFLIIMAAQWPSFLERIELIRDFTIEERLLTQARALGYYLWKYLIPGFGYVGLYGDNFEKSTSLLQPLSTLWWVLVHVGLVALAVWCRKSRPLLSFGILFFYTAHLMESSIVPLELFFEHRNYLPSAFLFAPLAAIRRGTIATVVMVILVVIYGALLKAEVEDWRSESVFYSVQYRKNPASERAVTALAEHLMRERRYKEAVTELRSFAEKYPIGLHGGLTLAWAACRANDINEADIQTWLASVRPYRGGAQSLQYIERLASAAALRLCSLDLDDIRTFLDAYLKAYPRPPLMMQAYYGARAIVELHSGNYMDYFNYGVSGLRAYPNEAFTISFCRQTESLFAGEGCGCLMLGERLLAKEDHSKRTLPRLLLGYTSQDNVSRQLQQVCEQSGAKDEVSTTAR